MTATLRDEHEQEWGAPPKPPIWLGALELLLVGVVIWFALELIVRL